MRFFKIYLVTGNYGNHIFDVFGNLFNQLIFQCWKFWEFFTYSHVSQTVTMYLWKVDFRRFPILRVNVLEIEICSAGEISSETLKCFQKFLKFWNSIHSLKISRANSESLKFWNLNLRNLRNSEILKCKVQKYPKFPKFWNSEVKSNHTGLIMNFWNSEIQISETS